MYNVFIDGKEGTTGLQIFDRLEKRSDVKIITLPEELRKDTAARKEAINASDITFLCLPDGAAKEAVTLAESEMVKIIDASTAHRTLPDWAYGFPELSEKHREKISNSNRIANPGCYASGFISLVYPLVKSGIAAKDYPFVCHAVSGYSGAGKKGIAQYEAADRAVEFDSPRLYGLTLQHKHLPEMKAVCGLDKTPIFNPYVCDYYCGMTVNVPLFAGLLQKKVTVKDLEDLYNEYYGNSNFISIGKEESGFIAANVFTGTNKMQILVNGNDEQILLSSRFDNLGKGASGAAVQNMN
ncbi:MAG: N-acetyl-gamma-glutamyl-phosphate reductase, partial [Clostridia bacterium]|nr:N-acetyl-gamma-glutamyl-phosphate reductase [Clostridia bacterium]